MDTFSNTVFIAKPVAAVFTEYDDHTRANRWIRGLVSIEPLTPPPHGVGTKWKQRHSDGTEFIEETTAYEPNRRSAFKIDHDKILTEVEAVFQPEGNGTRLTLHSRVTMRWWLFKLLRRVFVPGIQKRLDADLARLKQLVEAQ
jgi:uncharacterized protein YndB with AHSA1/START domain